MKPSTKPSDGGKRDGGRSSTSTVGRMAPHAVTTRDPGRPVAATRFVTVLILAIPLAPYLDQNVLGGVPYVTTIRIVCVAGLIHLSLGVRGVERDRWTSQAAAPAVVLSIYLATSAFLINGGIAGPAKAVDTVLLPSLVFILLVRAAAAGSLISPVTAAVGTAVLGIEAIIGAIEFRSGAYFLTLSGRDDVLAYGFAGSQAVGARATGTFVHPEEYAVFGAALSLFLVAYFMRRGWAVAAYGVATLGVVIGTASGLRGILLPFAILTVWVIAGQGRHRIFRRATLCAVASLAAYLMFRAAGSLAEGAISDRFTESDNIYTRIASFESAARIFWDHPLVGVGYGGYFATAIDPKYSSTVAGVASVPFPHNSVLGMAAETGLVGLSLFAWLWVSLLRTVWQSPVGTGRNVGNAILILFIVSGLSLNLAIESLPVLAALSLSAASLLWIAEGSTVSRDLRTPTTGARV